MHGAFSVHYQPGRFTPVEIEVVPGSGVAATIDDTLYRIGKQEFVAECLDAHEIHTPPGNRTDVYLADSQGVLARFEIGDELRSDAMDSIAALRRRNFRMMIASGDHAAAVAHVAGRLGIQSWHANLTPPDKLALVHELREKGETVVMIGDGINDAPVLAAADASVALDAGTALARASADAVSLGRQLGSLITAVDIAAGHTPGYSAEHCVGHLLQPDGCTACCERPAGSLDGGTGYVRQLAHCRIERAASAPFEATHDCVRGTQ